MLTVFVFSGVIMADVVLLLHFCVECVLLKMKIK